MDYLSVLRVLLMVSVLSNAESSLENQPPASYNITKEYLVDVAKEMVNNCLKYSPNEFGIWKYDLDKEFDHVDELDNQQQLVVYQKGVKDLGAQILELKKKAAAMKRIIREVRAALNYHPATHIDEYDSSNAWDASLPTTYRRRYDGRGNPLEQELDPTSPIQDEIENMHIAIRNKNLERSRLQKGITKIQKNMKLIETLTKLYGL